MVAVYLGTTTIPPQSPSAATTFSPILLFLLSRIPMLLLAPLRGDFFTSLEADFALR